MEQESKGIELKTVNPVVFDDPNKCTPMKGPFGCKYRTMDFEPDEESEAYLYNGWICWLFDYKFPPCSNEKCQECKDHYQKAIEANS